MPEAYPKVCSHPFLCCHPCLVGCAEAIIAVGRTGGTVKVMGLDNITEEQNVKSELGVVFDTNYFSDDWKVPQVENPFQYFIQIGTARDLRICCGNFTLHPPKR